MLETRFHADPDGPARMNGEASVQLPADMSANLFRASPPSPRGACPRVAIVHYWLVGMQGAERVLEALLRMFPQAEIFTHVYVPENVSPLIRSHKVHTTSIARLPFARRYHAKYLPLMPRALEEIDLTGFDLVISSEAAPAKGVIPPATALHLCYCHSPMRNIWDQYHAHRRKSGVVFRHLMPQLARNLRMWDIASAARVDGFIANSVHVQKRIQSYWRRSSDVIPPPVSMQDYAPVAPEGRGSFYLWAGELSPENRPDIAIEAFNRLGLPLIVIGGPHRAERRLTRGAAENIRFLGEVAPEKLRRYLACCKALVVTAEEDFGMRAVEAMASGRPVIALGRGGVLDTVIDRQTGLLYSDQSAKGLADAVEVFESEKLVDLPVERILRHAHRYDEAHFRSAFHRVLARHGMNVHFPAVER